MNDKQFEKTKLFHCKQGFSIDEDLTALKWHSIMSEFLEKDIANALLELATIMEEMMKTCTDPRLARTQLMVEELGEAILGLANCDELETLDGLADLEFVTKGTAIAFGLPLPQAVDEVCASNLTKAPRKKDDIRLRDKGPNYVPPNLKRVLDLHRGVEVDAIRTNCVTDKQVAMKVLVNKKQAAILSDKQWIWIVKGGVTGYESMRVDSVREFTFGGWSACAGTKGRWDTLFLPAASMQKINEWLKETE